MHTVKEKFSVIIPVYNEANVIEKNLKEVKSTFDEFGCAYEIIVIDDGSEDTSYQLLKRLERRIPNLIVKRNSQNFGKGRALKKAFKYTTGDLIVWLDADLDLHPFQVKTLYDIMVLDDADVVVGSKLHPNSKLYYPFYRRLITLGYYVIICFLFNLPCHDTQTGLKIFKRKVLREVFPRILVKKFAFDLEVLLNAHYLGFRIVEAPIVVENRRNFYRIGVRSIANVLWDTLAVWYRMYILRYYDRINYYRRKNLRKELRRVHK